MIKMNKIIPWVIFVIFLIIVIILAILLGIGVGCKECQECKECEECEECDCEEEGEEGEEGEEWEESSILAENCKPAQFTNIKFTNKRIKVNVYPYNYYLCYHNGLLVFSNQPTNKDYWSYDGDTLKYAGTNIAIRYVNSISPTNPEYPNGFYNPSGFIQIFNSDGFLGEYWNFDGVNFYYRAGSNDLYTYMLTPKIKYNLEGDYNSALTIVPVSTMIYTKTFNDKQPLQVVDLYS